MIMVLSYSAGDTGISAYWRIQFIEIFMSVSLP